MKEFFKYMFASMLGCFLSFILLCLVLVAVIGIIVSMAKPPEVETSSKMVLHIRLQDAIPDRTSNNPMSNFDPTSFSLGETIGLDDILRTIDAARTDTRIKGIFLDLTEVQPGLATLKEIRESLLSFKQTGKFVIAYGDHLGQLAYYIASVADQVYLNPQGTLDFRGFNGQIMFIRNLLDKLQIEAQVIRHGKYKSAIEPLVLDQMSPENETQTLAYINSMWEIVIADISASRKIPVEKLNLYADSLSGVDPVKAGSLKLVDGLKYRDEILDILSAKAGISDMKKSNLISLKNYYQYAKKDFSNLKSRDKIAVIYATGDIIEGTGDEETIGSTDMAKTIREARKDKSVKAIVLRVNSPGGSALASDIILREVTLARKVKPVVVSMGNVAASGGYYISCGASKILADPTTITGSIGVFGVVPNFRDFFKNKIGITFDEVSTNANADYIPVTKPMSEYQKNVMLKEIEKIYSTFVNYVATNRKMTYEQVDSIAQGRVWSGTDALKLGLIDEIGGMERAIQLAAQLANLKEYRLKSMPEIKDPFTEIMEDLFNDAGYRLLKKRLGENYGLIEEFSKISRLEGIQARMPYYIEIE